MLVNEEGSRERHLQFTPFGKEYSRVGPDNRQAHYFAGHAGITYPNLHPNDSGLYYMGARWYDPASGTFLSVDPVLRLHPDEFALKSREFEVSVREALVQPQLLNTYSYVGNRPTSYVDVTGEVAVPIGFGLAFGAASASYEFGYQLGESLATGENHLDGLAIAERFVYGAAAGTILGLPWFRYSFSLVETLGITTVGGAFSLGGVINGYRDNRKEEEERKKKEREKRKEEQRKDLSLQLDDSDLTGSRPESAVSAGVQGSSFPGEAISDPGYNLIPVTAPGPPSPKPPADGWTSCRTWTC